MATRMLQRRGTAAEWAAENPVLADGEIGYARDSKTLKVGDGVTAWNDLRTTWVDQSAIDAKGDILAGTGPDTYARLPVGADNTFLVADSTQPEGMKWGSDLRAATAGFGAGYVVGTQVTIGGIGANTVPLLVEGTGGQTNDLQQWWATTAGPTVAAITKDGGLVARSVDTQTGGGGIYSGGGLYNKTAEAIILGYAGATGRLRISDDGASILYFQHDREIHFSPVYSSTNRKRIRTNDYATAVNFNGGVTTDWSWPTYLDSGEDSQWRITDGWGYYRGRILTNAGGPYADPLAVYLPFNLTGSYGADRNSWRNGRVVGRYTYIRNDGSATYEGVLVRVGAQANTVNAIYNNGLLSLQPGQYDRLHVEIHAPTAS